MTKEITTKVCVVGGGPAGMMCGFLLARAGIETLVIEKHSDFLRDFRGDTVHPSTLELMHELGILKEFLQLPHQELTEVVARIGDNTVRIADFRFLPTKCKFIAFTPQWHFLNFLAEQARRFKTFSLRMETAATDLIFSGERVTGVVAGTADGTTINIAADLVIAADGRSSIIRDRAGLHVENVGAPMDILWMRLSRKPDDPNETLGRVVAGAIFIMLNRDDYWQCGYAIAKGTLDKLKSEGLDAFRARLVAISPFLSDRVQELTSWDDIKLLTVRVDRLEQWYRDGLLCIGDAAHAMSPVFGVGINLAVQDAVAAANMLWRKLKEGRATEEDLRRVQQWRLYPTRMTQRLQVAAQNRLIKPTLESTAPLTVPLPARLLDSVSALRRIPAHFIGIGFRPESIASPLDRAAL